MIKFENTEIYLNNKKLENVESYDIHFHENNMLPKITIRQKLNDSWISFNAYWLTDMKKNGTRLELEIADIGDNIV